MIKNYFKIAWRNISRHPFYSFVNVLGLFAGITFTLLITAYVYGELEVNKKLDHASQQYILTTKSKDANLGYSLATFGPLAKRLKEDYPAIVNNYYRFDGITSIVSKGEKHLRENIQIGDSTLLKMYGFELLYGNAATALNDPYNVVLTKEVAEKYFGKTNVVGETINIQNLNGNKRDFAVAGVLKELPENSVTHLSVDNNNGIFISASALTYFGRQDIEMWSNLYVASYVELQKGKTIKDLQSAVDQLVAKNTSGYIKENISVVPVALTEYHLQKENAIVKRMLYALSFVGLFILLMAVINFINIAISRSSARMKEIGIRKVSGGTKQQLVFQFLTESVIFVLIATALAVGAYPLLRPLFSQLVGKNIPALSSFPVYFVFILAVFVFLVGILAGLYPAFVLTALKSVDSLKGKLKSVKENIGLRKSLVGVQFAIALIVLVASVIVTQQLDYFFSKNLGYNKEFVVASQVPRDWSQAGVQKMTTIRNEFSAMPQVANVTLSYEIPDGNNGGQAPVYKAGADSTTATSLQVLISDEKYLDTYQVPLVAGTNFNGGGLDSGKVIINETAAHTLGFTNATEAVNGQLRIPGDPTVFTIKAVCKDFHFGSMQQNIAPCMSFNVNFATQYRYLSFKIKPGNISSAVAAIEKKWNNLMPGSSFEYKFIDETLKKVYRAEIQLQKAAYTAAGLSLIIVLIGVLGLVSLSIQKRTKEIGIRKVLGSSVSGIIALFMKEFLTVILIAGAVACPIAWYIMHGWLNDYAYRISMSPLPFLAAITGLVMITTILIMLQTLKAGTANPVKSLRTE
ncbi:ABC transporter permease [Ferruginibacter sp.]